MKKSKFVPGPPRKSEARIVVTGPSEYNTNLDGKSCPITGQAPHGADSISANLTAPNTLESTLTKNGKAVATATTIVSNNGEVTITTKGL